MTRTVRLCDDLFKRRIILSHICMPVVMIQQREKQNLLMQEKEDIRVIAELMFLRKANGNGIQDSDGETDFTGMGILSCCNKAYLGWKRPCPEVQGK